MGLAQTLTTESGNAQEFEEFINSLSDIASLKKTETGWIVSKFENQQFIFEIQLIANGFYIHRSGNYFSFFGFFIEAVTGNFGRASIEDV